MQQQQQAALPLPSTLTSLLSLARNTIQVKIFIDLYRESIAFVVSHTLPPIGAISYLHAVIQG